MSQRAVEIVKISDLKSVKNGDVYEWSIDYEEFQYRSGEYFLKSRAGLSSPWEIWPLEANTKSAANRKVFQLIK
ncbi:hypothetical protein Sbal625DRAFT_4153 [Shewanella baltica OS625]|uniref:hypothetical protein n=1 Tax=Shewanella baltica TaxID=62322 RepID=UPI000230DF07|nr:hypothetical protein [Shewanella baltica]EHC04193.1 hypothetical protein Sbal625DRAFT_4153 [Shewanella baltica OS625]